MSKKFIKQCTRCVMDDASDSFISFDKDGHCNYCNHAKHKVETILKDPNKELKLKNLINSIKEEGKGKEFDCLMGISGGLDSAYLAYLGATKWGLRICAVHIDDGFDTELAKQNIENLCKYCGINLIVIKPNERQFLDLTSAFIRAEVPNIAIPQDNILFAMLYKFAKQHKIRHFLSGSNIALESIIQKGNTHSNLDSYHIKQINRKFGKGPIDKLPLLSLYEARFLNFLGRIKTSSPLNYIDYNKFNAIEELSNKCGFKYYEAKHLENTLTKVIQLKWFVEKFNVDKRKSHLSSLIISGQMSREEALTELAKPMYNNESMKEDVAFVLSKLAITEEEFEVLLKKEGKQHTDYPTSRILKIHLWLYKKLYYPVVKKIRKSNKNAGSCQ